MSRYEELGFFDFEDFVEELNEEELFSVNGGACGAGSSYNPTPHYGGSCAGGGAVTPSKPYTPPTPTCGGGYTNTSNNQGSFEYITNTTARNARMQDYKGTNEDVMNGFDKNGNRNLFSLVGCRMMACAKILTQATGKLFTMQFVNNKYDKGNDGNLSTEEIGDSLKDALNGKKVIVDYWSKKLNKDKLDEIIRGDGTTYIIGQGKEVYKGEDHYVIIEGYKVNQYGQVEFIINPTSSYDTNRTYILGTPNPEQKNTYQIDLIETFTIK